MRTVPSAALLRQCIPPGADQGRGEFEEGDVAQRGTDDTHLGVFANLGIGGLVGEIFLFVGIE